MKTVARYIFSVSVFTAILYLFDSNDVLITLADTDILNIIMAVLFSLAAQILISVRLHQLLRLQSIVLGLRKLVQIVLSAVFYGLILPGGNVAAFAVRLMQLSRVASIGSVASALFTDRLIATVTLIFIGAAAIAIDQVVVRWIGFFVTGLMFITAVLLFRFRSSLLNVERFKGVAGGDDIGKLRRLSIRIHDSLAIYSTVDNRQGLEILSVSLLAHICGCIAYYVIAIGIGLDVSFVTVCWIRTGLILAVMIPVSVAGLGLREISAIGLFLPLGFSEAQAISYSVLILLGTAVIPGILGGLLELSIQKSVSKDA
jgi:uncharacterized protein (TIRG00374 family)